LDLTDSTKIAKTLIYPGLSIRIDRFIFAEHDHVHSVKWIQRAKEKFPEARPQIISDNGPQFIARDFKEFIRIAGMSHVTTSPYYPQSNGKMDRWYGSLKTEAIRNQWPSSLQEAR
jgi:transposase InsO family protein